jgi:hypothetical protein
MGSQAVVVFFLGRIQHLLLAKRGTLGIDSPYFGGGWIESVDPRFAAIEGIDGANDIQQESQCTWISGDCECSW